MRGDIERSWSNFWAKYGETLPKGAEEVGLALAERADELLDRHADLAERLGVLCVCHGDSRLDNLALSVISDDVYLFDWQLTFKNMGPVDVACFLGGGLPIELRRTKERELVRLYYDELLAHGVEGLSFETCWDIYRLGHLYFLAYIVIGGTETDVANERSFKLFQTAGARQFSCALDHESLALLDRTEAIGL